MQIIKLIRRVEKYNFSWKIIGIKNLDVNMKLFEVRRCACGYMYYTYIQDTKLKSGVHRQLCADPLSAFVIERFGRIRSVHALPLHWRRIRDVCNEVTSFIRAARILFLLIHRYIQYIDILYTVGGHVCAQSRAIQWSSFR